MNKLLILVTFSLSNLAIAGKMPVLHKIEQATLTAPYSCKGSYEKSALFLSGFSKSQNAPDLLYNGACGSENFIDASTAGDDFTLIADLGDVKLEDLTASKSFNIQNTVGQDNTFKETQPVILNHTYAVLISKSDIRALYAFKVVSQTKDGAMTIRYAVKSYSIQETKAESEGFSWDRKNK